MCNWGSKHAGCTYEYVRRNDRSYVDWAQDQASPGVKLALFVAHCNCEDADHNLFACPIHRCAMSGPHTSKNGRAQNMGRQFFACKYSGDFWEPNVARRVRDGVEDCCFTGGWRWADDSLGGDVRVDGQVTREEMTSRKAESLAIAAERTRLSYSSRCGQRNVHCAPLSLLAYPPVLPLKLSLHSCSLLWLSDEARTLDSKQSSLADSEESAR